MLAQVLALLPPIDDPNVLVGTATADDAGVYRLSDEVALVQTVDFFTPIVDNPRTFGRIAAANALSDVYAMGAMPLCALAIAAFPEDLDVVIQADILGGGIEKAHEAGVAIMGGHTVKDAEPKYGLAVTGIVHPDKVMRNATARPGDVLVLTKPIGTGILTTARRNDAIGDSDLQAAVDSMEMLNRAACDVVTTINGRSITADRPVHAMTDVTGFGLVGHLLELARGSDVGFTIDPKTVPLFERVLELAEGDVAPGGTRSNLRLAREAGVSFGDASNAQSLALCDAQTSGGLLIAVAPTHAEELVRSLTRSGAPAAAAIGELTKDRSYTVH